MATDFFADRGTIFINSREVAHAKSLKLTIDESVTVVDTMTKNKRSAGYKKGNRKVSLSTRSARLIAKLSSAISW
ncbi:MAG: hypothetical protein EOP06_15180 [Proteobacteria bacterium]|nr:MAG: hypothetical protein EOP06_15180 [Pseudomonadota bacterium]